MKDKEKQIFDKYGNYHFPSEIEQDGLNTATSQIEEMVNIIQHTEFVDISWYEAEKIAEELYKHYQPKLPEDSVVLSKDEKQKLLHGMYEQGKFDALADLEKDGKVVLLREEYNLLINIKKFFQTADSEISAGNLLVYLKEFKEEAHKETAEKILNKGKELVKKWLSRNDEKVGFMFDFKEFIKEQFGVEIKEWI